MNDMRANAPAPVQQAIDLMNLTSRAAGLFVVQPTPEKQRFLRLVLKTACWQGGELRMEFEEPFETLKHSNRLSRTKYREDGVAEADFQIWLPGNDSNSDSRLLRTTRLRSQKFELPRSASCIPAGSGLQDMSVWLILSDSRNSGVPRPAMPISAHLLQGRIRCVSSLTYAPPITQRSSRKSLSESHHCCASSLVL
jgi:hypothetical protein